MGYELRRWLADRLPADISSGERLVALEIADQANDITRQAYSKDLLAIVARRAGYANTKQVRKVLTKLAANRVELRVPKQRDGQAVLDRLGRPVYAHEGHETTYRIPTESECPALVVPPATPSGLPTGGPLDPEAPPPGGPLAESGPPSEGPPGASGPPAGDEWAPAGVQEGPLPGPSGPPSGGPFSSISPQDPLISPSGPERHIRAAGATAEETREIISIIKAENRPRSLTPYVATLAANGDLAALLARVRSGVKSTGTGPASSTPQYSELAALPPCPHGMPGGDRVRPVAGTPACLQCRTGQADVVVKSDRPAEQAPAGPPPDLSGLRSRLTALTTRTRPDRPSPVLRRQLVADELPDSALADHAYLLGRGDAHVWTSAARDELGQNAPRAEVMALAAELARRDRV